MLVKATWISSAGFYAVEMLKLKCCFYALRGIQRDDAGSLRGSELEKGWDRAAALDSPGTHSP